MMFPYRRPAALAATLAAGLAVWLVAQRLAPAASPPSILTRRLPRAQALADLASFQQLKEAADAGLYKYRSKTQMDSAFARARTRVTDQMTVLEVYQLLVGLTDFAGSLHNETYLPGTVRRALEAEPAFFPYPLKQVAGQVVLNHSQAPVPLGSRVVSINGLRAQQLVRELGVYYTTDGVNTTGKTVGFASSFPKYYRLAYGPQTAFVVRYCLPTSSDTLTQTLPAVPYASYRRAFATRHSSPSDHSFFEDMPAKYTFQFRPAQSLAILTINTFSIGEDDSPGHRRYARFLDSCFTLLRRSPATTRLLVDVRGNGGGDDDNDMLTFSYLTHAPFRENQGAVMTFTRVPYQTWLTVENDTVEQANLVASVAREIRTDFTIGADGRPRENARGNPVFHPQPNRFRGQLYLLISPRVASAGSMFAAMVRGNTAAVVIGEETMGGYYGHTGHTSLDYTLPNTGIGVQFSCVDLRQQVPRRPSQPAGRGVLPDYAVSQSMADFLQNRDTQLHFALDLIAQSPSKHK